MVDPGHPGLDLPGQGPGPLGILQRQQHGKHLAAGAEHDAALAGAAADDLADAAQCRVTLTHAVELVIELEVVHIDVQKCQALPAAGEELLFQLFHKEAVVVHAGQRVDAGLPEHLLVKRRVLHSDGRNGADRLQKADLHGVEVSAPLLGGKQQQSHDLFSVPHGGDTVDVQPPEQLLFRLPDGKIPGAAAELAYDEIAFLLFEVGDLGAVFGNGKRQRRQGAGAVAGLVAVPFQQADIHLLDGDLPGHHLSHLLHDVRRAQRLGDLRGEVFHQAALLLFPGEHGLQQPPHENVCAAQQSGKRHGHHRGGGALIQPQGLLGKKMQGRDEVGGSDGTDHRQHQGQKRPGHHQCQPEHAALVKRIHQKGREYDAG